MKGKMEADTQHLLNGNFRAIGNDLVYLPGFRSMLSPVFIEKVYTEDEKAYCLQFSEPTLRYASTWAAKEAVYKALKQLDPRPLGWKDIEIRRNKPAGKPEVLLRPPLHNKVISLSLSHDGDYVWAIVLIEELRP
ncbi:phosphopantetheine--protein transferase domain protein [compost metagenome]